MEPKGYVTHFPGPIDKEFCPFNSTIDDTVCKKCDDTTSENFMANLRYFLQVIVVPTKKAVPNSKSGHACIYLEIIQKILITTKKDDPYTDGCSKGGLYAYRHAIKFADNDTKIKAVYFKAFHPGKKCMKMNLKYF